MVLNITTKTTSTKCKNCFKEEKFFNNNNNNNNNLFKKNNNEWLSYKTNRGGTRRIQEHLRKVTRTYKYRHAKTLRSNRFKVFCTSSQNKSNNSKWNNYLVSPTFSIN